MKQEHKRADLMLTELGLAQSREKARALIMSGVVYANEVKVTKAGEMLNSDTTLAVRENTIPFVSRGGLKLQKAIEKYGLNLQDLVAADIGASTGGFTDCMLMHGAKKVYAIDVGYGQLDWKLRSDDRVVVMERTNARLMEPDWFEEKLEFASIDVSFISVGLILPNLHKCMENTAHLVVLIKPQFEAGREKVGKNGVVRSKETHCEVIINTVKKIVAIGFEMTALDYSPITGPKGNIEFLFVGKKTEAPCAIDDDELSETVKVLVNNAHGQLT